MSMDMKERHVLTRLKKLMAIVPVNAPDTDQSVAMTANRNVLALVLNAQEPAYKSAACLAAADKHLDELDHFVTRRHDENWRTVAFARH